MVIAPGPRSFVETRVRCHASLGNSFGNRIRLNAALAKTNNQSTFANPRNFTLRIQAIVFNHPNAGSIRGRACWLFLLHFLGDIHQPLHASTDADAGGNCVTTTGLGASQLHASWDSGMVDKVKKSTPAKTATALLNEFHDQILMGGETDVQMIEVQSFTLAKDEIYAKAKPMAVPVIDHFVDLTPDECSIKAPAAIQTITIDGLTSCNNDATKQVVRLQLFRAGARLATILNALFQ